MGKSSINVPFSMAMLNNQRVPYNGNLMETQPTQIESTLWVFFSKIIPEMSGNPCLEKLLKVQQQQCLQFQGPTLRTAYSGEVFSEIKTYQK